MAGTGKRTYTWRAPRRFTTTRQLLDGGRVVATLQRRGILVHKWTLSTDTRAWPLFVKGVVGRRVLLGEATDHVAALDGVYDGKKPSAKLLWKGGRTWRWTQRSWWDHGAGELADDQGEILRLTAGKDGAMAVAVERTGTSELEVAQALALWTVFVLSPTWTFP